MALEQKERPLDAQMLLPGKTRLRALSSCFRSGFLSIHLYIPGKEWLDRQPIF